MGEQDPKDDWWAWVLGKYPSSAEIKKTFWDDERVKHHPDDRDSKDWAVSEPDPNAP